MGFFKDGKRFCFTLNNYTEDEEKKLKEEVERMAKYAVWGHEEGEEHTPHLQGFVVWKNKRKTTTLKHLNERIHWENTCGESSQAAAYCKKDGKDIYEFGKCPVTLKDVQKMGGEANKKKWSEARRLAKEGKLDDIDDAIFMRNLPNIMKIRDMNRKDPSMQELDDKGLKDHFLWLWGETGTGKSHQAREIANKIEEGVEPYLKELNKWWDDYAFQRVTIIEEASPKACEHLGNFFKRWADKWSFHAEVKKSSLPSIRPEYIIVTSNYSMEECFPESQDYEPLKRRFTEIHLSKGALGSWTSVQWPSEIKPREAPKEAPPEGGHISLSPNRGPPAPTAQGNTTSQATTLGCAPAPSPDIEAHEGSTQEFVVSDEDTEIDEDEVVDILAEGREAKRRKVIED